MKLLSLQIMKTPQFQAYLQREWGYQTDGIVPPIKGIPGAVIQRKKSSNSSVIIPHSTASLQTFRFVLQSVNRATTSLAGTATVPPRVYSNS